MERIPVRTVAVLVAAPVAVVARPDSRAWSAALRGLRGVGPVPSLDGLAALVVSGALWVLALWVLLALVAGRLAGAPGPVGAASRVVVRLAVPRALHGVVVRGLVSGGVAGGLLLGPAAAAVAVPVWPTAAATSTPVSSPGPAWPTSPAGPSTPAPTPSTPTSAGPTATGPTTTGPTTTGPTTTGPGTTGPGTTGPGTTGPGTTPTPPTGPTDVVVAPGDSLWSIAAADLRRHGAPATDAAVAAAWPAWFAVNRAVVGTDPGLLHPGTHLSAPPATPNPTTPNPTTPTDGSTP